MELSPVLVENRQRELERIGRQMSAAMRYEPFYSSMGVSCPKAGAYLGRVALSDSPDGRHTESIASLGLVAITTGDRLRLAEPDVDTTKQLSGAVAADAVRRFQSQGEDGLASLPGIHAGVIVDVARRQCVVFNDKYGRERLFMHVMDSRLLFASEAKAILAVAPETRAFDTTGLAEFFSCGCTLGARSLYRDVEILESATVLTVRRASIRRHRYFAPNHLEELPAASEREFLEAFPSALHTAVNGHIKSGPPVAVSLTGGLDSRMVMAVLDAPRSTVPTYTFGSMYRSTADVSVGRQVAERSGQPHHVIELGRSFVRTFDTHLSSAVYISDAYLGLSAAAELYVNRQARSVSPARMTGNWGGELMRGVRAFKSVEPKGAFLSPDLATAIRAGAETLAQAPQHSVSAALFQQAPMQGYGRNAIERSQLVMRHPFLDDDVVCWLYRAPAGLRQGNTAAVAVIGRRPELLTVPTDRGLLGTRDSKVRRATREVLVKAEYLTSHGAPNWLSRVSARLPAPLLESRFLGVDKFQHFRYWTRRELAPFVRETLVTRNSGALDDLFDMRRVAAMVDDHISGRANYIDEIDKLLTLAVAQKTLFSERFRWAA